MVNAADGAWGNPAHIRTEFESTVDLTNQRSFAVVASSRIAFLKRTSAWASFCTGNSGRSNSELHMKPLRNLRSTVFAIRALHAVAFALFVGLPNASFAQVYGHATHSSPIALSQDNKLIWVVNPGDDSVSVIRPDLNQVLARIGVGDEPQSVALTPDGQYAYVANAAGNSVTVIKINNPAWGAFSAVVESQLTTGAEPWNIVAKIGRAHV